MKSDKPSLLSVSGLFLRGLAGLFPFFLLDILGAFLAGVLSAALGDVMIRISSSSCLTSALTTGFFSSFTVGLVSFLMTGKLGSSSSASVSEMSTIAAKLLLPGLGSSLAFFFLGDFLRSRCKFRVSSEGSNAASEKTLSCNRSLHISLFSHRHVRTKRKDET